MATDDYLIEYDTLRGFSIRDLLKTIEKTKGKRLDELKVMDLTYHNSIEIWRGEGVYIFKEQKRIIYVGKASSMSFTERIPKHFDLRHDAWFNRLLELICIKILGLEWNDENAIISSKYAFKNLNLVLINFKDRKQIDRIERLLRSCAEPLNEFKKLKEKNHDKSLDDYVK
jgi:hypothetical protein